MAIRLLMKKDKTGIRMRDLNIGDIGVVTDSFNFGKVFQIIINKRTKQPYASILGENDGWSNVDMVELEVRKLEVGEVLEIVQNG